MKKVLLCTLLYTALLTGCAAGDHYKKRAVSVIGTVINKTLDDFEFVMCWGAPLKTIAERYWTTPADFKGWYGICSTRVFKIRGVNEGLQALQLLNKTRELGQSTK